MWNKMFVAGLDFDDDRWEDPSVAGWLMLFCIWLMVEIVAGVWGIFQMPYTPGWAKWLGYLCYILPAYSLTGLLMRFKDAVQASLVSIMLFIFSAIVNLVVFIAVGNVASSILTGIFGVAVNITWIVYLCRSKLVSVRFPKEERRLFGIDWILFVFSVALSMLLNLSTLGNLANFRMNSSEEYRETLDASRGLIGLNDQDVHFVDCAINGKYCVVYFAADDESISDSDFNILVRRPYFSDNLLFQMNKISPEFIKSAIGDGLILQLNIFNKNVNDGMIFKITPDQIRNLKEPEPLPDLTEGEMSEIGKAVVEMLPSLKIEGVSLESCEWANEVVLSVIFKVDEDKTRYTTAYDAFKEYSEEVKDLLMHNRMDPYLDAVWSRNMSIKFVLKGSKSGYTQSINVF